MSEVICFGEIMLRLAPEGFRRFVQADRFEATYAGAEANVAVSLANMGVSSAFVSRLPQHDMGAAAMNALRRYGVDTQHIVRGGEKLGIYYVEKGASQRSSCVIYDRAGSAFQTSGRRDYNWDFIFQNARWFHFTGITPSLGDALLEICMDACRAARERNITVSCDLNYRSKLWRREQARAVMERLCPYVDVCIANEKDAYDIFGIDSGWDVASGEETSWETYENVAQQLYQRFGFRWTAITLRSSISASENRWSGLLYDGQHFYHAPTYTIHVIDRIGSGDSFGAGLIYSGLMGTDPQQAVEFATAASCLNHSLEGDFNLVSVREINALVSGDKSGRIKR